MSAGAFHGQTLADVAQSFEVVSVTSQKVDNLRLRKTI